MPPPLRSLQRPIIPVPTVNPCGQPCLGATGSANSDDLVTIRTSEQEIMSGKIGNKIIPLGSVASGKVAGCKRRHCLKDESVRSAMTISSWNRNNLLPTGKRLGTQKAKGKGKEKEIIELVNSGDEDEEVLASYLLICEYLYTRKYLQYLHLQVLPASGLVESSNSEARWVSQYCWTKDQETTKESIYHSGPYVIPVKDCDLTPKRHQLSDAGGMATDKKDETIAKKPRRKVQTNFPVALPP
ncbi:hypothetical protein K435DRAFT_789281 [Dendrothele bispora CBS 962.96]|uniref:Uncharacterized protein n=1 Tax=Dendrothele bispora (strain CBS 962.96) TaxID=1314807 RepID=A0A4S8MVU5_DENBC|nr:hypothetical protein K435DRAFT_789281 [Dendrothele bispora CBS 962.96]